jgi:hypothetical protein
MIMKKILTQEPIEDYAVKIFVHPRHRPYRACFTIGVQSFHVCEREDKKEAEWYASLLQTAFDNYALYLGYSAGKLLKEKDQEIKALKDLIEKAFLAGRSQTSWEQFKKDHNI